MNTQSADEALFVSRWTLEEDCADGYLWSGPLLSIKRDAARATRDFSVTQMQPLFPSVLAEIIAAYLVDFRTVDGGIQMEACGLNWPLLDSNGANSCFLTRVSAGDVVFWQSVAHHVHERLVDLWTGSRNCELTDFKQPLESGVDRACDLVVDCDASTSHYRRASNGEIVPVSQQQLDYHRGSGFMRVVAVVDTPRLSFLFRGGRRYGCRLVVHLRDVLHLNFSAEWPAHFVLDGANVFARRS